MSRHLGLASRVRRLERNARLKRPRRPIVYAIYPENEPGPIIGLKTQSGTITREYLDQDFAAFVARAAEALGSPMVLQAIYQPKAALTPVVATPAPAPAPIDPFALAGIGRVATATELRRWAVTPRDPVDITDTL